MSIQRFSEIIAKIIDYCDMECDMCGQLSQEPRRARLPLATLQRLLSDVALEDTRCYVWGGEPLLHPEFEDLITFLKHRGAFVAINTNGSRLAKHAQFLAKVGVDRIIVSVDGTSATHDRIRRSPGAFGRISAGLDSVAAASTDGDRPLIRINFVVLPDNYEEMPAVLQWCRDHGIYRVRFQLPMFVSPEQISNYSGELAAHGFVRSRSYDAFRRGYAGFDFSKLAALFAELACADDIVDLAPYGVPSAEFLKTYFETTLPLGAYGCDIGTQRLVVDTRGCYVTCPDFPDMSLGDNLAQRAANLEWWSERLATDLPLSVCARCCRFSSPRAMSPNLAGVE
jgi:sulfatase maturation enzyme AslB (radical SAM superfamily)